jgi:hypothetical protein
MMPIRGGAANKGLRANSYQNTRKIEADYNPSHTTETLIGFTAFWHFVPFYFLNNSDYIISGTDIVLGFFSVNSWIFFSSLKSFYLIYSNFFQF